MSEPEDQYKNLIVASFAEKDVLVDALVALADLVRDDVRGDGAASLVQAAAAPATEPSVDSSYSKLEDSHSNGANGLD